jgi:Na+/phosphate symporter
MIAREFGVMDYVVGIFHLTVLVGLFLIGLAMIYRGIKNQKI